MLLKTKPIVKLKAGDFVRHPNGVQSYDITKSDLEKNPELYVNAYPHLYENADALKYELGLLAKFVKKGTKVSVNQKASKNGQVYPVIVPVAKKTATITAAKDTAKQEMQAYMQLIAGGKKAEPKQETKKTGRGKNK